MNDKRDWKIYFEWIDGKNYNVLAKEFNLSVERIKEICVAKVPEKIRSMEWQRTNQYAKFRAWKRSLIKQDTRGKTPLGGN